jgi:hypothetical protein
MGLTTIVIAFLIRKQLKLESALKQRLDYPTENGEFVMNDLNYLKVFAIGMASGTLTGAVGIGTGLVVMPGYYYFSFIYKKIV